MLADVQSVAYDEVHVHALASLLKRFLRDPPEPLLTFELYDDFIRGTEIVDLRQRAQFIFAVVNKLPYANHLLLERLVYHLARYMFMHPKSSTA